jgi:choline-sulfatase
VSTEEIRRSKAAYYGLIELMDGFIGAIVEQVKKTMRIDDTLIIYASDHGDMIGDKGLFWKSNFYEGSAKVPLIFSLPGEIPEGRKIRENTSLLDLGPTLIDFCAGPELPRADGISVLELLKGEESKNENRAIISQLGDVKGDSPSAMIRYGNWKLISHLGYEYPQLFDLKKDPAEVNDLAQNPSYLAICRELQDMLDDYWDGEAVSRHIKDSYAHTQLLRRWQSIEQPDDEEQWVGDSNNNYLIT